MNLNDFQKTLNDGLAIAGILVLVLLAGWFVARKTTALRATGIVVLLIAASNPPAHVAWSGLVLAAIAASAAIFVSFSIHRFTAAELQAAFAPGPHEGLIDALGSVRRAVRTRSPRRMLAAGKGIVTSAGIRRSWVVVAASSGVAGLFVALSQPSVWCGFAIAVAIIVLAGAKFVPTPTVERMAAAEPEAVPAAEIPADRQLNA